MLGNRMKLQSLVRFQTASTSHVSSNYFEINQNILFNIHIRLSLQLQLITKKKKCLWKNYLQLHNNTFS